MVSADCPVNRIRYRYLYQSQSHSQTYDKIQNPMEQDFLYEYPSVYFRYPVFWRGDFIQMLLSDIYFLQSICCQITFIRFMP